MHHPTSTTEPDGEALRTVIEATIVSYFDSIHSKAPDAGDLANRIGCAVEELLAARAAAPPAPPAPEGDEV
ncbi:hypothetical protein ACFYUL_11800 [Streptomyces sp. NPDC004311]|uniref:hypothetical protein n=1 Tax=Streptomyces sp. NPDC004311 TaxID=3364698 RepID=UPI0036A40344